MTETPATYDVDMGDDWRAMQTAILARMRTIVESDNYSDAAAQMLESCSDALYDLFSAKAAIIAAMQDAA